MILFRLAHAAYPFLWESPDQPAARWHSDGEGPVHYFSTTADGAWAELLRHEEIMDEDDLAGLQGGAMWVVELDERLALAEPTLERAALTGGMSTYAACQAEARRLREGGSAGLLAPSAAIRPGGAVRYRVDGGLHAEPLDSKVVVLFGPQAGLRGELAAVGGRPHPRILEHVRPLTE